MYRRLVFTALALTLIVVVLGAYVRLADAGLGCPDWPGCYGQLSPAHAEDEIARAQAIAPDGPVSTPKAWKEMIHRYLAATLGLIILVIAAIAFRHRRDPAVRPNIALALVGVVIFQGLLGKWTVTLLLKPAIVTGHLVGGMTTLSLLALLALRAARVSRRIVVPQVLRWARIGLLLVIVQIVLGGWTSTNYAALACTDFPTCHGQWWPAMDVGNAFHVLRELGMTADGQMLSNDALTAIHWMHRIGALAVTASLIMLSIRLIKAGLSSFAIAVLTVMALQLALGIANVLLSLPLTLAVAHNAGATLLLLTLITVVVRLRSARRPGWDARRNHEIAYA